MERDGVIKREEMARVVVGEETRFVQVLEIVLGRPEATPLCQVELERLRCVSKEVEQCVTRVCFGSAGKWFVDPFGVVQPIRVETIHPVLCPLVVEGFLPIDHAVYSRDLNRGSYKVCSEVLSEELSRRWTAMAVIDKLSGDEWTTLAAFAGSRSRRKLWMFLSCGSIWSIALGIIKPSRIISRTEAPEALFALLGLNELGGFDKMKAATQQQSQYMQAQQQGLWVSSPCSSDYSSSSCSLVEQNLEATPNLAERLKSRLTSTGNKEVHHVRSLREQWEICKWLWVEAKKNKNKNVRNLVKYCCMRKTEQPSGMTSYGARKSTITPSLVRLLVESRRVREALASNVFQIQELMDLYLMCGLGHVKQVLSRHGIEVIQSGKVSIKALMKIPKHNLVKKILRSPDVWSCSQLERMKCAPEARAKFVELIIQNEKDWKSFATTEQLLQLPSIDALEFVLSSTGIRAFQEGFVRFSDFNITGVAKFTHHLHSFRKSNAQVLEHFFQCQGATELLKSCTVSIPELIHFVKNTHVLAVLLSPSGRAALTNGNVFLKDFEGVHSGSQALQMLQSSNASSHANKTDTEEKPVGNYEPDTSMTDNKGPDVPSSSSSSSASSSDSVSTDPQVRSRMISYVIMRKFCTRKRAEELLEANDWKVDSLFRAKRPLSRGVSSSNSPASPSAGTVQQSSKPRDKEMDNFKSPKQIVVKEDGGDSKRRCVNPSLLRPTPTPTESSHGACDDVMCNSLSRHQEQGDVRTSPPFFQEDETLVSPSQLLDRFKPSSERKRAKLEECGGSSSEGEDEAEGVDTEVDPFRSPKSSSDMPSSEQLHKLLKFLDVTGVQKEDYAVSFLKMCNWNVDTAIQTYLAL